MPFVVRRLEVEGTAVIARSSNSNRYPSRRRAQNDAERLARGHSSFSYDQERKCWQGRDIDGRIFRYVADHTTPLLQ